MDDHQKSLESSPASAIPTDSRSSVLSPIANWKISSFAVGEAKSLEFVFTLSCAHHYELSRTFFSTFETVLLIQLMIIEKMLKQGSNFGLRQWHVLY
ncbi:uncharacterized protein E5676_scaffold648G00190 [Cucumis melo var. makuwa]|uniref:Uncharacterized protein n=1 Tax=Cucumis melo var. makuwa TaxID=1194695 RepID=A0A5D3CD39_CUCMM|nr:uncharacterized protein E6C27_scaffold115G00580 [Cucumis melo var. makuwa]TYK08249.1 uncharacterized protein E5676_scaffold648G00190 [Cucumis melo var. makuwa]